MEMKKSSAAASARCNGGSVEERRLTKHQQQPPPPPRRCFREVPVSVSKTETETRRLERKVTEDINESAEAFIKKFRNQLLIQRLESIENYEKMLAGGTN